MGQCAYRLGKAFGAEAERAGTTERRLEYFHLFDRCFFAVRMSIALELRLGRAARAEGRLTHEVRPDVEREVLEREPAEHDTAEIETYTETEGDREREPVSLPVLLRTLDDVAAAAAALPGREPAALPTLRELLATVKAGPASTARPGQGGALRARLAGSAVAPSVALTASTPLAPRGRRGALALRRATGPPR